MLQARKITNDGTANMAKKVPTPWAMANDDEIALFERI
jgi:hypothetical protein